VSVRDDELTGQADADAPDPVAPDAEASPAETPDEVDGEPGAGTQPAALPAGPTTDPVVTRFLLPLLLPLVSILAVGLLAVNISRVFLASGNGAQSVIAGTVITFAILGGAAAISAAPQMRTSTLTMVLATSMVVVVMSGLLTLGAADEHGEGGEGGGYQEPAGEPVGTLAVEALQSIKFDSGAYTAPAGIVAVELTGAAGHTLVYEDPELAGFKLALPNGPEQRKVELAPGEYVIFCDIAGHRAQGMEATVTVAEGGGAPADGAEAPPAGGAGSEAPAGGE